jgi:murein hydrolase activator
MISRQLYILATLLIISFQGYSQDSQKKLEEKREKLNKEIAYANKLLNETQSDKNVTLSQLKLLNVKIDKRTELLATLNQEVYHLDNKIEKTESSLFDLNEELINLKRKYSKIAWHAYKYKTAYNKLIFLFSSDNFNQAYQRMRYLDQISSFIRQEAERIKNVEEEKNQILSQLKAEKLEKSRLLDYEQDEILEMEKEQAQKDRLKINLLAKERQLKDSIKDKEKQSQELAKKIQNIISAEIASKKDESGKVYDLTPSEKELSSSFTSNKGKLPWPTESGVISETFGVHKHPVLKKVKTKNNGINILTSKNSEARSVFNGKVVGVTTISNTNIAVIIKHGEFFTVYSNLDKVNVNKGDEVNTNTVIGNIHTNLKGRTELHFEVWKGTAIQNPSYWLSRE